MSIDESFYVAVSFATIIALFIYLRIPQRILQALDDKTDEIKKELEAAQHLREEAQALLKTYQAQGKQAEKQAAELIANARAAAERQANEATQVMERQIE
ncbi:MAG: ATP F0F1 synthase subunit B, partial [Alphaproteobacteria bacterium]|nr:ATP F0F1 synthase subunit B [Alphaproteobacteria bacterium]